MPKPNDGWRAAALLLHPSSLYSPYGIGDLGPAARQLASFFKRAGLHLWQMLPLTPTSPALGNSPYSAYSAFAGNNLLISPEDLVRDGWLNANEVRAAEAPPSNRIDFKQTSLNKSHLIDQAFNRAANHLANHAGFQKFACSQSPWLNDYAFFMAAKEYFGGGSWLTWPESLCRRDERALHNYGTRLARPILREKFAQYLFFSQLLELRAVWHEASLGLIGDTSIYVNHDSSDVWAQPHLFHLDSEGHPTAVAGVPPDYFTQNGQLWGNPLFNWDEHRREGFNWWKNRLWHGLKFFDWLRLDHFRAFAAYWAISPKATSAAEGTWQPGPGMDLFTAASEHGPLNIIAEDLGIITPDVTYLRQAFAYPGMRVLQFAFGEALSFSTHAPYRIEPDNAVYSATHDNNTSRGWFRLEANETARRQLTELSGFTIDETNAAWALIRLAWLSPAALAVTPLWDLLNLDENSRLNTPGTAAGNWAWKLTGPEALTDQTADHLANLSALAGRDNFDHPNILTY
ncbi:MAG: 4-alpha-glucanotransferase [Candidatus Adiutrix intracellularis]|jgi:4-alpha-glucanotransferase|nr:4-alpha-glucanotransferase [Candidatus Adiutrix intracellularis]